MGLAPHEHALRSSLGSLDKLRVAQVGGVLTELGEARTVREGTEPRSNNRDSLTSIGQGVGQNRVEPTEERFIEDRPVIRRGKHEGLGAGFFKKDKEGVQDASGLTDIVACAVGAERVELIKQLDGAVARDCVENKAELAGGLAHELAQQAIEPDRVHRQGQLRRQHGCGHCFSRTRWPF